MTLEKLARRLNAVTAVITMMILALGVGRAQAITILTFDGPAHGGSQGAAGPGVTSIGSGGLATVDFSRYDMIFISQSRKELLSDPSLLIGLAGRGKDLTDYLAAGGKIVFGSPNVAAGLGNVIVPHPSLPEHVGLPPVDEDKRNPSILNSFPAIADVPAVPEPSMLALMALGLSGIFWVARKRPA
jgi:hypothetical protein